VVQGLLFFEEFLCAFSGFIARAYAASAARISNHKGFGFLVSQESHLLLKYSHELMGL